MKYSILMMVVLGIGLAPEARAEASVIRGRVVDAQGQPVAKVAVAVAWTVDAQGTPRALSTVRSGDDGTFALVPPTLGLDVTLLAYDAPLERGAVLRVEAGRRRDPAVLTLAPLVTLRGDARVQDSQKYPWDMYGWLSLAGERTPLVRVESAAGRYHLRLPPGEWTLTLGAIAHMPVQRHVTLTGKEAEHVEDTVALPPREGGIQPGELAPPVVYREVSAPLADLLARSHLPPRWTLCYFFSNT